MIFDIIKILLIPILFDEVISLPVNISQEALHRESKPQDNNKVEQIHFDTEMHDYFIGSIIKRIATFLGLNNPQDTLLEGNLSPWPRGEVPYIIDEKFNDRDNRIIMSAIGEFHKYTCVRFVPYDGERAYIRIKLGDDGCYSPVGYFGKEVQVHLQVPGCGRRKGTVIHELMHVIGFIHEQSRHDRDDHVIINWRYIKNGGEYNFYKFQNRHMNNFGFPYDYGSIMHYSGVAFSINEQNTIIPKIETNIEMGQRKGFSEKDIAKIRKMYEC